MTLSSHPLGRAFTLTFALVVAAPGIAFDHAMAGQASQSPPDFSGRWTAVAAAPAASGVAAAPAASGDVRGDMGSGWASTITIVQTADRLTVEQAIFTRYDIQPPVVFAYALDGSETRNTLMMGRGVQVQTSRAAWADRSLKITTRFTNADAAPGQPREIDVVQTLTLESPASLVVEVTRSAGGAPPTTTRTVYKKN